MPNWKKMEDNIEDSASNPHIAYLFLSISFSLSLPIRNGDYSNQHIAEVVTLSFPCLPKREWE
jgi:hypothetical protein